VVNVAVRLLAQFANDAQLSNGQKTGSWNWAKRLRQLRVISTTGKLSHFDHLCVQEAGRTIYVLVVGSQEICEQHADGIASHPQPSRH
jgi:hypothetical protein